MVDRDGNNLALLLCTPRSGSSLATAMLQNHSRMFAAQEMWFLMSLHDLRAPGPRAYGGAGILRQFYNGVLPDDTFIEACRAFALEVYNGLLRSGGGTASLAIDKSPRYYGVLEFMDALFPRARRIWLIRNPLAVLASHKKVGLHRGSGFDTEAVLCGEAFDNRAADLTIGLIRYFHYFGSDRVDEPLAYRLHYEKLVAAPQEELAGVCRFLGVAYEEGMEVYGGAGVRDAAKSELYFSMGVGDPFVAEHSKPHQESVDAWKQTLTKREAEMYVRLLGARLFRDLGYGEQLDEAERWIGVRFEAEPDAEMMALRTAQLVDAAGFRWQPDYRMKAAPAPGVDCGMPRATDAGAVVSTSSLNAAAGSSEDSAPDSQLLQLQMTVRMLENRLDNSVRERRRLQDRLDASRRKVDSLKSLLPFGNRLSRLVSTYLAKDGGKR